MAMIPLWELEQKYHGLCGEVTEADVYRIRGLPFYPTLVFDIGANVGFFTRYILGMFPFCRIVAVEPEPTMQATFEQYMGGHPNVILDKRALGQGKVYTAETPISKCAHHAYLSPGPGYDADVLDKAYAIVESSVGTVTLPELFRLHGEPTARVIVKMDCEGAENAALADDETLSLIAEHVDFFTAEIHFWAHQQRDLQSTANVLRERLHSLTKTHEVTWSEPNMVHALQRKWVRTTWNQGDKFGGSVAPGYDHAQ